MVLPTLNMVLLVDIYIWGGGRNYCHADIHMDIPNRNIVELELIGLSHKMTLSEEQIQISLSPCVCMEV